MSRFVANAQPQSKNVHNQPQCLRAVPREKNDPPGSLRRSRSRKSPRGYLSGLWEALGFVFAKQSPILGGSVIVAGGAPKLPEYPPVELM